MGAVYRVEQLSTGRHRALKVLGGLLADDDRARDRFRLEARIGGRIASEHVVEVVAAGFEGPQQWPWLAMELLQGADLRLLARRPGGIPRAAIREILRQLVAGLRAAHRAGVVHRDLKPENVFVSRARRDGVALTVKILDFGIAKLMHDGHAAASATSTVGTPLWMAPEQLNRGALTAKTDLWALGLLAFWILTGEVYWQAAHEPEVAIEAVLTEILISPPTSAQERAGALGVDPERLPPDFDAWFSRCVARDPAERFETTRQAGLALEQVLRPLPSEVSDVESWLPASTELVDSGRAPEPSGSSSSEIGATLAATDRELYLSSMFRVVLREDGVVHVQRTATRVDDMAEYVRQADQVVALVQREPFDTQPVLMDFRLAPPRNDDAFERTTERYRQFMSNIDRPLAMVVGSMAGRLQMARLGGQLPEGSLSVFGDEQEALAFLHGR